MVKPNHPMVQLQCFLRRLHFTIESALGYLLSELRWWYSLGNIVKSNNWFITTKLKGSSELKVAYVSLVDIFAVKPSRITSFIPSQSHLQYCLHRPLIHLRLSSTSLYRSRSFLLSTESSESSTVEGHSLPLYLTQRFLVFISTSQPHNLTTSQSHNLYFLSSQLRKLFTVILLIHRRSVSL